MYSNSLNLFKHLGICQDLNLFTEEHEQKILLRYAKAITKGNVEKWKQRYTCKIRNFLLHRADKEN
jgi:hypothetical protein